MTNHEIADTMVKRFRQVIVDADTNKEFKVTMEDLVDVLACLERLSILERHLTNLVSTAYEN